MRDKKGAVVFDLEADHNGLGRMIGRLHHLSHIMHPGLCEFCGQNKENIPLSELLSALCCLTNLNKEILDYLQITLSDREYLEMKAHIDGGTVELTQITTGEPIPKGELH